MPTLRITSTDFDRIRDWQRGDLIPTTDDLRWLRARLDAALASDDGLMVRPPTWFLAMRETDTEARMALAMDDAHIAMCLCMGEILQTPDGRRAARYRSGMERRPDDPRGPLPPNPWERATVPSEPAAPAAEPKATVCDTVSQTPEPATTTKATRRKAPAPRGVRIRTHDVAAPDDTFYLQRTDRGYWHWTRTASDAQVFADPALAKLTLTDVTRNRQRWMAVPVLEGCALPPRAQRRRRLVTTLAGAC